MVSSNFDHRLDDDSTGSIGLEEEKDVEEARCGGCGESRGTSGMKMMVQLIAGG